MTAHAGASRSVGRVCEVLEYLAAAGSPMPFKSLLKDLGLARSTAYDLLKLLRPRGHVVHEEGHVALGPALWPMACSYLRLPPVAALDVALAAARDRTQETVHLSVLHRGQVLVVRAVPGSQPTNVPVLVGRQSAVNWTAAGLVLLRDMDGKPLEYFLTSNVRPSPTGRAELQVSRLAAAVRSAAQSGFAVESGHVIERAGSIAVPVQGADGKCVAALGLELPAPWLRRDCASLVRVLQDEVGQLSRSNEVAPRVRRDVRLARPHRSLQTQATVTSRFSVELESPPSGGGMSRTGGSRPQG